MTDQTPAEPQALSALLVALERFSWGPDGVGRCSWCQWVRGTYPEEAHADDCPMGVIWRAATRESAGAGLDVEQVTHENWPPAISDGLALACSDCRQAPRFDYHVSDSFWAEWGDGPNVVCLPCLDRRCQGVGLAAALLRVHWTGTGHTVVLTPTRRLEYRDARLAAAHHPVAEGSEG